MWRNEQNDRREFLRFGFGVAAACLVGRGYGEDSVGTPLPEQGMIDVHTHIGTTWRSTMRMPEAPCACTAAI